MYVKIDYETNMLFASLLRKLVPKEVTGVGSETTSAKVSIMEKNGIKSNITFVFDLAIGHEVE